MSEEMTSEQAIKELKNIRDNFNYTLCPNDVFDMAIAALSADPCSDAISRDEVLDLCDSKDPDYRVCHLKEDIECMPPVHAVPKTEHCRDCK